MIRLHLVGFTTDLKNLIFGNEPGATSGGYVVSIDPRLRRTLEEVARMEDEAAGTDTMVAGEEELVEEEVLVEEEAVVEAPPRPKRVRAFEDVHSKLTPKEIQALVRQGKSEEQVARLAGTDVAWVRRFTFPILAERAGVIEAVRSGRLSRPRLGPSVLSIGEAIEENLGARHLKMGPQQVDESWKAVRKNGLWQVSFDFPLGGKRRAARFSFDPETRHVEALNDVAIEIGYKAGLRSRPGPVRSSAGSSKQSAHEAPGETRHRPRSSRGGGSSSAGGDTRPRTTNQPKPTGTRGRGSGPRWTALASSLRAAISAIIGTERGLTSTGPGPEVFRKDW
jgi:hypothetical protein